jgi:hypothetical protein
VCLHTLLLMQTHDDGELEPHTGTDFILMGNEVGRRTYFLMLIRLGHELLEELRLYFRYSILPLG